MVNSNACGDPNSLILFLLWFFFPLGFSVAAEKVDDSLMTEQYNFKILKK